MKDGWWLNYRTGRWFPIHEHELWIRTGENARLLGGARGVARQFGRFRPVMDRNRFLLWLMEKTPVMRIRGHRGYVTFEFHARACRRPLQAIAKFAGAEATPPTCLHIVNLATEEAMDVTAENLCRGLRREGGSAFWRTQARPLMEKFSISAAKQPPDPGIGCRSRRYVIRSGRCGYRYHDLGHGAGALLWWVGPDGRIRTCRSIGTRCLCDLPGLGDGMDAVWRGRLDQRTGTATLCPPRSADAKVKPGPAPAACRRLLRWLSRRGAKRFYIATREGLRQCQV